MYQKDFVASNDGNISCKVSPKTLWATPAGVSKGFMERRQLVKITLDGTVLKSGSLKVSSEIKMHLRVYNENPAVNGVTHAHPLACTAFACAGLPLDTAIHPGPIITVGIVPCVHYETPGAQGVSDAVAPYCKGYNALLLANHGALSWGTTLTEAFYRMETMEHLAMLLIYTGGVTLKPKLLCESQVKEVIKIREKQGVFSGGGLPSLCAGQAENTKDIILYRGE
ncbi:aldolase [Spirochaetia bacterium]|nr:aldolase [Spirochaetia bacterium]